MTKRKPAALHKKSGRIRQLGDVGDWDDRGEPRATVGEVIIEAIGRGLPGEVAAAFAGVSYASYRDWLVDGRRFQRRAFLEQEWTPAPHEQELIDFVVEVNRALAGWVSRSTEILEAGMMNRRKVTTRIEYVRQRNKKTDEVRVVEVGRVVTTVEEPIDTGPILWRLTKLMPAVFGPNPRYEQESTEGESEEIDIGARVDELLDRITATLTVVHDEGQQ